MAKLLFLVCLLVAAGVYCSDLSQENGVYVLTPENFDDFLAQNNQALIEFYAPWCGHCKKLAPEYEAAAAELSIPLAKVDAAEHRSLGEKFGVRGFPTLFWFENGQPFAYEGGRTKDTIISWVTKRTLSALPAVNSAEEFETAKATKGINVFLFEGSDEQKQAALSIFRSSDYFNIFEVADSALTAAAGFAANTFAVFAEHLENALTSTVSSDEDIATFFSSAFPSVVEFDQGHFQRMAQQKEVVFVGVAHYDVEGEKEGLISLLNSLDADKIGLMYADAALLARGVEAAGASGNFYPTIVAIVPKTNQQLVWDEDVELNTENLQKWAEDCIAGTASTYKKSEPVPENSGALTTLVWKNWDTIKGKNAFVKFYAPWCGHCKSLAPIWDELAENFKDSDVIIGKFDATANYIDEQIQGYPTLIFYNADGTKENYEGARELEALTAFVNGKIGSASASGSASGHSHDHDEL